MADSGLAYTVVGISEASLAVAVELRLRGRPVILTDRPERKSAVEALATRPALRLRSDVPVTGFSGEERVVEGIEITLDIGDAIRRADVVIVMVQPNFQEALLEAFAGCLRNEQILLLCPGGLGGSLLASRLAAAQGASSILIGQAAATPHAARLEDAGATLRITGKKKRLPVGVYPAGRTEEMLGHLGIDFPQFTASRDIIENGLARAGLGLHPVPMIMNASRIESDGGYIYDGYDITPSIAAVIDAVDAERQDILRAFGATLNSFSDILKQSYGVEGDTFYDVVHNVGSYKQAKSPPDLNYRYLSEDVPTQVVPAASLGRALGLATPMLDAVIAFANAMHGVDYRQIGWNLEKLGLAGKSVDEIMSLVRG